ncbi:MAG TPA: RNA 2',3'-cyclic phosphodiesterase [Hyphomonadaceae bacterium]|nr:RNA 2',3'-cyclic phosphodiesterase [Hyphomonadaceae bacterium]
MSLRLFAAIAIPAEMAQALQRLQRGVPRARWRDPNSLHVTLRFFGEAPERAADDLDGELGAIAAKSFDLVIRGAGHFGGADPHALYLGVEPHPALLALAEKCDRAALRARRAREPRDYLPHVTMAYLDPGTNLDRVMAFSRRLALFRAAPFRVERFGLYSSWLGSRQSSYQLERDYPLS